MFSLYFENKKVFFYIKNISTPIFTLFFKKKYTFKKIKFCLRFYFNIERLFFMRLTQLLTMREGSANKKLILWEGCQQIKR